jgi:gentisate 1,2-dioxygenase
MTQTTTEVQAHLTDVSGRAARSPEPWPALIVRRAQIEAEIERLADIPLPANGRRTSSVVHPCAPADIPSLSPGIEVTIEVLRPGEETAPVRRNSNRVEMCIRGSGTTTVAGRTIAAGQFDVWNIPAMQGHGHRNTGGDLWVRLCYSNAPLLERLEVHYVEEGPEVSLDAPAAPPAAKAAAVRAKDHADDIAIDSYGARLLGYEHLIDIDVVESKAHHWPWLVVNEHLHRVRDLGEGYTGRRLYVLYNPATERRIGTTHSFFATIAAYPPDTVDVAHRHTSAAINYYFAGNGKSVVAGQRMEWEAGDLMFAAPGWVPHVHGSRDQGFLALTIQDHPLQIAMDSLVWQETLQSPIRSLGSEAGFQTNLAELATT